MSNKQNELVERNAMLDRVIDVLLRRFGDYILPRLSGDELKLLEQFCEDTGRRWNYWYVE